MPMPSNHPAGRQAPPRLPHPRHNPPQLSKSLHPHKKQKLAHLGTEGVYNAGDRLQSTSQGLSSDESASEWFDKANTNAPATQDKSSQPDNDPPFFLSTQQNSYPEDVDPSSDDEVFGAEHEGGGENEELRGVIDDLTVENKRLRRMLKSQRPAAQNWAETQDRLFELRVHGLSANKKRELELLLRNFTAQANSSSQPSSSATYGSTHASAKRISHTSYNIPPHQLYKLQPADSGYGSNFHSGANSIAVSSGSKLVVPVSRSSRNKNIKSYLHDIPDTLFPGQGPNMSDRAKQTLVVRRLEQIFTGQQAAPGEHSQPIQQQEISQSAAKAEAKPGRMAKMEGTREAQILPYDANDNLESIDRQTASPVKLNRSNSEESQTTNSTPIQTGSPDQRPTRPLDLDIHRAQVASDNIEYIRHLGLSTPRIHQDKGNKDHSWIYLNLLTGMAQLHTLNVTPAFVQTAIKKLSTKFELSEDGRQVRWKGGSEGTTLPTFLEERLFEASIQVTPDPAEENGGFWSRRSKTTSSSANISTTEPSLEDKTGGLYTSALNPIHSTDATSFLQTTSLNTGSKSTSAFDYRPLFYKGKKHSPVASYLQSTSSSCPSDESGEVVQTSSSFNLKERRGSDEGMITFYNNPFFCSDASADKSPINWKARRGLMPGKVLEPSQNPVLNLLYDTTMLVISSPQFAPKPVADDVDEAEFSFSMSPISASGAAETLPMELEASGIGGVWPADNFALDVKVQRQVQEPEEDPKQRFVPVTASRKRQRYSYKTAKCEILELRPSTLPPPSYLLFASSSSSGNAAMEDSDSDTSSSADEGAPALAHSLKSWSRGSSEADSDEDEDRSESVDILALARAADPDQVAAQEREYVLNRPSGFEGSLAATVGASRSSSSAGEEEGVDDGLSDRSVDGGLSDED